MAVKSLSDSIREVGIDKPNEIEYYVSVDTANKRQAFIKRVERYIRNSKEYRDYIQFLKENVDMDKCAFFQHVCSSKKNSKFKVSIEIHHEPFTLYEYVEVVLNKFIDSGMPINDLLIADEVLNLHYENKVGLIPLSKTIHQMVHNSNKILIPLSMCYGEYSKFMDEYTVPDEMYDKLEQKIYFTKNLTEEAFDAIKKEFTYLNVEGFEDAEKMEIKTQDIA